jgi:trigger factor
MTNAISRQTDGTIDLTITIPWADVAKSYEDTIVEMVKKTELPGFRAGKAPRELVEKNLDKTKIYEEVLKVLIPGTYNEAITQEKLKPIVNPKIELKEATENKDWVFHAYTCERPAISLGDYKTAIGGLKSKILKPGEEPKKPTLDELLAALYGTATITLPSLLIEHEVNRLLSELIDQTKKLGLTVEQYLASTQRTSETIKKEYEEQARRTLTLEFSLEEIADGEGVIVSDDDIDAVIKTGKTDEEKEMLSKQRYYLASVLRRQKTLDYLATL